MDDIKSILESFEHNSNDQEICSIYDDGKSHQHVTMTFNQVFHISNIIQRKLSVCSAQKNEIIGLFFNSDSSTILGIVPSILAIMTMNCAFLVFDLRAQSPLLIEDIMIKLHIRFIITDDGPKFLQVFKIHTNGEESKYFSTNTALIPQESESLKFNIITVNYKDKKPHFNNSLVQNQQDLIYIVQTSGTTSPTPMENQKLIFVSAQCILPNIYDFHKEFQLAKNSIIFAASPPTFDPFYVDLLLAFRTNSIMLFVPQATKSCPDRLLKVLNRQAVNFMQITPTLFESIRSGLEYLLLSKKSHLRTLLIGGETFPNISAKILCSTKTAIYNLYGVSEMSCWQTCLKVNGNTALDTTKILDTNKTLVLSETKIEICTFPATNDNSHDATKYGEIIVSSKTRYCQQMVGSGFISNTGIYRVQTGDVGYIQNGCIFLSNRVQKEQEKLNEFHTVSEGSKSFKINGKRISLSIIETSLENVLGYKCICLRRIVQPDSQNQIAAFVLDPKLDDKIIDRIKISQKEHELFKQCVLNLPSHYIPQRIILIPKIPMTLNGKQDNKSLFNQLNCTTKSSHMMPTLLTTEELKLVVGRLWFKFTAKGQENKFQLEQLQKVPTLSDQFVFDGGGDSILAMMFVEELEGIFGDPTFRLPIEIILNKRFGDIIEWIMAVRNRKSEGNNKSNSISQRGKTSTDDVTKVSNKHMKFSESLNSDDKSRFTDGIFVASRGSDFFNQMGLSCNEKYNLSLSVCIPNLIVKEQWNVNLLKCVDASPVAILDLRKNSFSDSDQDTRNIKKDRTNIFIGSHSGLFVAVDLMDGSIKWKQRLGGK